MVLWREQKQRDHLRDDTKLVEKKDDNSLDGGGYRWDCKNDKSLDIYLFFSFLELHLWHMEITGLCRIRAAAAHLCHSNAGSELQLQPTPQLAAILNPLSKARDQIHIFIDTSQVLSLLSHNRNSWIYLKDRANRIFSLIEHEM